MSIRDKKYPEGVELKSSQKRQPQHQKYVFRILLFILIMLIAVPVLIFVLFVFVPQILVISSEIVSRIIQAWKLDWKSTFGFFGFIAAIVFVAICIMIED